jgi:cytidylate kinase
MERAAKLLQAVDEIPDTEVSKKAHALKTLSDVITAQIRNERRTWNIDEKGADTSLEALLDELDEEDEKRKATPKPVVVQ